MRSRLWASAGTTLDSKCRKYMLPASFQDDPKQERRRSHGKRTGETAAWTYDAEQGLW